MEYFSTKEVAIKYGVDDETVRRWIRDRKLKAENLGKGKGYKICASDLESFIKHNKVKTKALTEDKPDTTRDIFVSTVHLDVPVLGGVAAVGLVLEIIQKLRSNGILDNDSEMVNIQLKKYALEKRKIEIMALINSLNSELLLIEHELKTAEVILP